MDKLIKLVINKLDEINLKNMDEDRHSLSLNPNKSSEIDKIIQYTKRILLNL